MICSTLGGQITEFSLKSFWAFIGMNLRLIVQYKDDDDVSVCVCVCMCGNSIFSPLYNAAKLL